MDEAQQTSASIEGNGQFPVVGIGASAGGLEAFIELIQNLPPMPGMAFVLVQHLDPHHASLLPEIISRSTTLPVSLATDGLQIERNHVYVIAPNSNLALAEGRLVLSPREEIAGQFMPIDHFFRSLARERGGSAIAVVLSGGGTDGALGLEDVKAAEGIVFAQDETTAKQNSMPRSAASTGQADFVLAPAEIGRELGRLAIGLYSGGRLIDGDFPVEEAQLRKIFELLRKSAGVDFSLYKRSTIKRRIHRRMGLSGAETMDGYFHQLAHDPVELEALFQDFLIRVTRFFRDPDIFVALREVVFPTFRERGTETPIRIWVAGCSTGEEVYSLAIELLESLGDMVSNTPIKILATDLNEAALERARAGVYVDNIAMDVSQDRLRRYFTKVNGSYQISKAVRDLCVFSKHNVATDPPFARLDLISCRNVLIYLDAPLQMRVLPYFHYALQPSGFLLLGTAETIGTFGALFDTRDKEHRIYVKKLTSEKVPIDFPAAESHLRSRQAVERLAVAEPAGSPNVQREVDRVLYSRYAPPSIAIDDNLNVVQFRGELSPYLSPASGSASLNLLKLVRDELMVDLRDAIEAAKHSSVPVRKEGLHFRVDDRLSSVAIEVVPLRSETESPRYFLVLFESVSSRAPESHLAMIDAPSPPGHEHLQQELKRENSALRRQLQSVVEDNEAASEELKAANEEILSSNEELQSTNEELQTSKEEMQSANEELNTVNEELNHRNRELGQLNDDLVNLLGGLNIPIIMVNRQLRIRRFTSSAEPLFNLIASDVGRPISDLRPNLQIPNLIELLTTVINDLVNHEVDVQDPAGHWYSLRIRPYVTAENKIDGAAIAIVDIDVLKQSAEQLKASRDYADAIVETVWEPLVVLDSELRVHRANAAFYRMFHIVQGEIEGRPLWEILNGQWDRPEIRLALEKVLPTNHRVTDLELAIEVSGVGIRSLLLNAHRIFWEGNGTQMVLLAIEDITARKQDLEHATILAEERAARKQAETASRMKDEFLAMLAHELRNPLAPIRSALDLLRLQTGDDPVAHQALEISSRQVVHMARILDDLLDVSRITRGKIDLRKELVQIQAVIARSVETSKINFDNRGQSLSVTLPDTPVHLMADPARLEQVFVNLLHNATKYTQLNGQISIKGKVEDGVIVLSFQDNGMGISSEMLPRVFELFSQADRSLAHSQGGLGIGLTLVSNLVRLHGGSVQAFSQGQDQGSEFVVRLPILRASKADMNDKRSAQAPAINPRRILIVDDNVDAAKTMAMLLRARGHEVQTAESAEAALVSISANHPEIALLDIGLPGMDGYELARRLRAEPASANIVLIAITGYGQEEDRQRTREAGYNFHFVKPVNLAELEDLLATIEP
ncbi:MAG TPA: chemotaxis protein CheB [Pirellulales bacterium]|jgi:two-component system CheB/CheR fusion protein